MTDLLPHLRGYESSPQPKSPWTFGPHEDRAVLLRTLPSRVWPLVLCEYARSVLPVWERYDVTDKRPENVIAARVEWCREPSAAHAVRAAYAADAAHAACAAHAVRAAYAADAAHAACAAGAARAAAAGAAADAAHAARAAQWTWMKGVFLSARPVAWNPEWNTSTVVGLCEAIWSSRFGERHLFAVLADALEDVGMDHLDVLARLRSDTGPHTRADVAVWGPLGLGT